MRWGEGWGVWWGVGGGGGGRGGGGGGVGVCVHPKGANSMAASGLIFISGC